MGAFRCLVSLLFCLVLCRLGGCRGTCRSRGHRGHRSRRRGRGRSGGCSYLMCRFQDLS